MAERGNNQVTGGLQGDAKHVPKNVFSLSASFLKVYRENIVRRWHFPVRTHWFFFFFFIISNTGSLSQGHSLGWWFHRHMSERALESALSPGWSQFAHRWCPKYIRRVKHGSSIRCWIGCAKKSAISAAILLSMHSLWLGLG